MLLLLSCKLQLGSKGFELFGLTDANVGSNSSLSVFDISAFSDSNYNYYFGAVSRGYMMVF
jgi:hypothetical protein